MNSKLLIDNTAFRIQIEVMRVRFDLVHTYLIIAYDSEAGVMGGAVQSHYFSVGGTVIWAEAGSGVIATQAMVNMGYGPLGLALLKSGKNAITVSRISPVRMRRPM